MANATWNPSDKNANITLSGGNLIATQSQTGANGGVRANGARRTGKYYWEITLNTITNPSSGVGVSISGPALNLGIGFSMPNGTAGLNQGGTIYVDRNTAASGFGTIASGSVICTALDADAQRIWMRVGAAGNWNNSATANPATAVGGISLPWGPVAFYPWVSLGAINDQGTANFGDSAFAGAVPSGFTAGLPLPSSPLIGAVTQVGLEQWAAPNPLAQVTQVAAEVWTSTTATSGLAIATVLAVEQWAVVPMAATPARQTAVAMNMG